MRSNRSTTLLVTAITCFATTACTSETKEVKYDHYLQSKWNTVSMGVYTAEYLPALKIKSGEIVKIDIASMSGVRSRGDPKKFFVENNIPLKAKTDYWYQGPQPTKY